MEGGPGEVVGVLVPCDESPRGLERTGATVGARPGGSSPGRGSQRVP